MSRVGSGDWRPYIVSGVGSLLCLVLLVEGLWYISTSGLQYSAFVIGVLTSVPFILGLIYTGYWLSESELPPNQYAPVSRWFVGGVVVTVLLVTVINARVQSLSLPLLVGTVRWSTAIGGGIGVTIGIIQAQAMVQRQEAERTRRRKEQIERERDRLDEFASIVSHDLQNPLHVAKGRVALAREERDSEHLTHAEDALKRMEELIEDLLTLARTDTDVSDLQPVALATLTENCWKNVVTAEATLTVDIDRTVQADRSRLQQLLENLIQNAVEYGGENVTVTIGGLDDGFYVEDDGPGIPEDERNDVFETGYSTTTDGTGLGLSIVKQVAEAHGWDVRVTDGPDGGARFEITGVESAVSRSTPGHE